MDAGAPIILLVDESRFFLTIERQFLRHVPVSILEAQNCADAVDLCRRKKPQLIYAARELHDSNGIDLCRKLKSDPVLRHIPLVLVCEASEADACHAAGCDAVMTRPLDRHRFLEIGRSFLAGIRERRRSCLISVQARAGQTVIESRGLDISSGGVFIETTNMLPVGTPLQLELHLARPRETGPRISCTGIVAWQNLREKPLKPNHPVGLGVRFDELALTVSGVLNGYLRAIEH